jgi:hypothetical protein
LEQAVGSDFASDHGSTHRASNPGRAGSIVLDDQSHSFQVPEEDVRFRGVSTGAKPGRWVCTERLSGRRLHGGLGRWFVMLR